MNKFQPLATVFLFIFVCTGITAQAENQNEIQVSLDSAWEMMKEHSSELQSLLIDREILIREAVNKKYRIPGISAGASLSRTSPLITWMTNPKNAELSEADNWSIRGSIDMRLGFNFNISLEDQAEALELDILMLQRQSRMKDLQVSLQKLYYQILTGYNTIELNEQNAELTQKRLEQIETQYRQGLRSDLELLTAKIAVAKGLPALEKAKVDQKKRLITFRGYLGIDPDAEVVLSPASDFSYEGTALAAIENEALQTAEEQIKLAEVNKKLAEKNLFAPSLNLSLGWSSGINPVFDSASWTPDEWNDSLGLGLSLSVPISQHINGSEGRLSLQKLDDNIKKMKISLEKSRNDLLNQYRFLLLDLELNRSNIKASELNVTLQEQNFNKIQVNFDSGRASLLDLNDSRQELRAARLSLENEKLNERLILIDLARITGKLN